jgi:predicted enzyme related to lactoylglutathione lyase
MNMTQSNSGRFVWYDLMTRDPKAAVSFYGEVLGWKTQPFGEGGDYTMWVGSQGPLGGVMTLAEEAKKMGAPPHWMSHVEVADVDATVAKVRALGGKVYVEPQDIPTVGRFAIIADPQGATISAFQPAQAMTCHEPKPGEFCWSELNTSDSGAALRFYTEVFGWEKVGEFDMGPMGMYLLFGRDGKQWGGMMTVPTGDAMPPAWLYYVDVDDLDAAIGRATRMGAKVLHGPHEVPGGARVVQLMDPQGAAFALHSLSAKA